MQKEAKRWKIPLKKKPEVWNAAEIISLITAWMVQYIIEDRKLETEEVFFFYLWLSVFYWIMEDLLYLPRRFVFDWLFRISFSVFIALVENWERSGHWFKNISLSFSWKKNCKRSNAFMILIGQYFWTVKCIWNMHII